MDNSWTEHQSSGPTTAVENETGTCWKELLKQAAGGWAQTDPMLEFMLDRLEKTS